MNISNENSLKSNRPIYNITKFTHLDYPEHLAAIIWFSGCNMRCDFCYNKDIVFAKNGEYSFEYALSFLKSRKSLLDGVVLSGGEATTYDLTLFCKAIKELGFSIKLDTNGTNYTHVKELIELNLLDYIALDYKAPEYKFQEITHSNRYQDFTKTLTLLLESEMDFEVRTTLHEDLLNEDDINFIIQDLKRRGYDKTYFIQNFLDTNSSIADLKAPKQKLDKTKLLQGLEIVWR